MIRRKPTPAILAKYPVRMPSHPISNRWTEYSRMKEEFYRKFGHVDPRDYDEWIAVVTDELGI
jgi:hypothetical protein